MLIQFSWITIIIALMIFALTLMEHLLWARCGAKHSTYIISCNTVVIIHNSQMREWRHKEFMCRRSQYRSDFKLRAGSWPLNQCWLQISAGTPSSLPTSALLRSRVFSSVCSSWIEGNLPHAVIPKGFNKDTIVKRAHWSHSKNQKPEGWKVWYFD